MEYLPTIIVGGIIAVIFIAIIARGIKNIKNGKGGCSCGCNSCGMKETCHKK